MSVLMLFVDGLGIGSRDPAVNPVAHPDCSWLREFLSSGTALDCRLDMPGLPQSATGQTAIFTGLNAARLIGRHREGFPGAILIEIIKNNNIFKHLTAHGYTCAFANAYRQTDPDRMKRRSVTTVMTLASLGNVRGLELLRHGDAVFQDITNTRLIADGWKVPLISPEEAAERLCRLAGRYDLTLFEYFQTDRVGHKGDMAAALAVLKELQRFIKKIVLSSQQDSLTVILCSDHGNIEDISVRSHTLNSVPLVTVGPGSVALSQDMESITDIHDRVLSLVTAAEPI